MTATRNRIAYVLKGFPRLSESFIANEVRLLRGKRVALGLFSIKRGDALAMDHSLPAVDYLPSVTSLSATNLRRWLRRNFAPFATSQRYWLGHHPLRYLGTLCFAGVSALRYRTASGRPKKTFIKEFLFATYIARAIESSGDYCHIHAHFCHDATNVAWMAAMLTGLPFSFTAHAKDIYKQSLNPGDLLQRKLAAAEFTVTCTHTNVDYLRGKITAGDKIHGIYHGLNTRAFVPAVAAPAASRNGRPARTKLLAVGRMVEKKGFTYLIEACRLLRDRGVAFHLDIVGEQGDESKAVAALLQSHGLQGRVSLQPPVTQAALLDYYQNAAIFVLPCVVLDDGDRDGIPNVMAEAMACGLPVVVSRVSGIPEIVEDGVNGLLVPERDAASLADAIEQLIVSPGRRLVLGAAARQRIEAVFDADRTHDRLRELFDHAIAASTR